MRFLTCVPLTARSTAYLVSNVLPFVTYFSFSSQHLTHAAELDSLLNEDHNHHRIAADQVDIGAIEAKLGDKNNDMYEPEFLEVIRWITGRQEAQPFPLTNNLGRDQSVEPSDSIFFQYTAPEDNSNIYVTVNTCSQPVANRTTSAQAPQLTLYVSTSADNTLPKSGSKGDAQEVPFVDGFASYNETSVRTVYIGVSAPDRPDGMTGGYTVSMAASSDAPYHSWSSDDYPWDLADTDSKSALFLTSTTNPADWRQFEGENSPYTIYPMPSNLSLVAGMERSYCAIRDASIETLNLDITTATTQRGKKGSNERTPQQQVFVQGLNASSSYIGYWARKGNSQSDDIGTPVIGGGGTVWASKTFDTKPDGNCQIIFGLSFCSDIAYSVPTNPNLFNATSLAQLYDDNAKQLYTGFNYSLQQTACEAPNTQQYSLARDCTDCANDYKNWLCAVTIPRCYDLSNDTLTYLQPRSLGYNFFNGSSVAPDSPYANQTWKERIASNSSRNPIIDEQIKPGPYKELLPCRDLCYALVRSCPANLGFGCPTGGQMMLRSYGLEDKCNDPLEIFNANIGERIKATSVVATTTSLVVIAIMFYI